MALSADETARYARHLVLPGVGAAGQEKLNAARVLIVGLGGLGSPAAMYLAAAGVGTLGLVDADTVSLSNLQRQIIYTTSDISKLKVEVAAARLHAMNPHVKINLHPVELSAENALNIFADYDIIMDGTDNFAAHYLMNDAAVLSGKPLVYGNVEQFAGQVGVVVPRATACYRCLYPIAPPAGIAPRCEDIGVLGAMPGVIGTLQALEVLKLILEIGEHNKILRINGSASDLKSIHTARDENCVVCGNHPIITRLQPMEKICMTVTEITAEELQQKLKSPTPPFLLDVRNPDEFAAGQIDGAVLIPLPVLEQRISELNPNQEIIVYCHLGKRSAIAAEILQNKGFINVQSLKGGIMAWQSSGQAA